MLEFWLGLPVVVKAIVKGVGALVFMLLNVLFLIWLERKVSPRSSAAQGPNRISECAGTGLLQTLADGIKVMAKEDIIPGTADRWLFVLAPMIGVASAVMVWVVVPFAQARWRPT